MADRQLNRLKKRLKALVRHPFFWVMTATGNIIIFVGAFLLYFFESDFQSTPVDYIDCLLWSAGTVTTIGYGNLTPLSLFGKLTLLTLMLIGTLFVWSYMAFLVTGLIAPEINSLEKDVHDVEREIHQIKLETMK